MPPAAARNVVVILFDLKAEPRSAALQTLATVILYKQLSQSKDQYKLYLVNAARTSNDSDYEGICNLDAATNIHDLFEEILAVETGQSDWLEALDLAFEELKTWSEESGIITLQVLFITDLCCFGLPKKEKHLYEIVNDIRDLDAFLYIIGPSIDPPKTIFSHKDIMEWMSALEIDKNNSNLELMMEIVSTTPHSVMCNYDVGVHLFHSFKYGKGMQAWQVPLTFGTLFSFPVHTMRLTAREPPFRLKSEVSRRYLGENWVYEDQQNVFVDFHDTVSGLVKHGKFVKIETDGRFKVEGPRSFQALGFTSAENVPEYLLQADASYVVVVDPKEPDYFKFFNALVEELANSNLYIIAKRVYNKDFNPVLVALIPMNDSITKGFTLCNLPYADDIAHVYNEQNITDAPKVDFDKNVLNFLESIDVGNEKCQIKIPLAPTMMVYASSLGIINKVEEKYINESIEKKPYAAYVKELKLETLKDDWPVRQLEKIKKEETAIADFDDIGDFSFS